MRNAGQMSKIKSINQKSKIGVQIKKIKRQKNKLRSK